MLDFKLYYRAIAIKTACVTTKYTCRPMEYKCHTQTHTGMAVLTNEPKTCDGEKIASSVLLGKLDIHL
jgi:hypothetical protein